MLDGFRLKMCLQLLGSNATFDRQMSGLSELRALILEAQVGAARACASGKNAYGTAVHRECDVSVVLPRP